ncbi:MAG: hypothetical protein ACI92C_002500, partial [Neolewinella sp.]
APDHHCFSAVLKRDGSSIENYSDSERSRNRLNQSNVLRCRITAFYTLYPLCNPCLNE